MINTYSTMLVTYSLLVEQSNNKSLCGKRLHIFGQALVFLAVRVKTRILNMQWWQRMLLILSCRKQQQQPQAGVTSPRDNIRWQINDDKECCLFFLVFLTVQWTAAITCKYPTVQYKIILYTIIFIPPSLLPTTTTTTTTR